jgi:low temperature requirement protein LtrA
VFAVASLIWLTQALVDGLAVVIGSRWIAALIVGALLAAIAGALVLIGKNMVSAAGLAPTRTVTSLKRDGEALSERVI